MRTIENPKTVGLIADFTQQTAQLSIMQAALDALPGHIAILNSYGEIISVNARWVDYARQNGLDQGNYGIGQNYLDICRPAASTDDPDARTVARALGDILEGKHAQGFSHEYLCPHPGDPARDRWFKLTLIPFRLRGELCVLVSHEDITERHALEQTGKLLETAISQSRSGIMITNAAGAIEYVNDGFIQITGYSPEEVLGRNPRFLKSGKISAETYADLWCTISAGRTWKGEVCNRRKDGTHYWEDMTISPVKDQSGVLTHFVAVKEDITESRMQSLLHAGVINASADAFVAMDAGFRILEWSRQAETMLDKPRSAVIGNDFIDAVFSGDCAREARSQAELAMQGRSSRLIGRPQRSEMQRADGSRIPVELWLAAITLHGERRYSGFIRDLTETVRAERQLLEAQKMEGVGQMAGGLAHDFNNILNIVLGSLHLAETQAPEDRARHLMNARDAANHGIGLTRALSSFARREKMRIVEADVNTLIEAIAPLIQQTIRKRIGLVTLCEARPARAMLDVSAFNNALINLAVNARDAMPAGGKLFIKSATRHLPDPGMAGVDLPEGAYLLVSVRDTGEGMPPDVIARALDPFFTTKPEGKGTGLGLAMVNGFCRQSGGAVLISSECGQGTTVEMILPVARGTVAEQPA